MNIENIIKKLNPIYYLIDTINLTLLFDDNKIILLSDFNDKIMYSFFINKELIDCGLQYEKKLVKQLNRYFNAKTKYNNTDQTPKRTNSKG